MMSRAQGRAQRRALMRDIKAAEKAKARAHLLSLRQAIKEAWSAKVRALEHAVVRCRTARVHARARAAELRAKAFEDLRQAVELERVAARSQCTTARKAAAHERTRHAKARAELAAEQQFRREMRRIEKSSKERARELAATHKRGERQAESDDAVRGNIPPELVRLFDKVRRQITAGPRQSRTEAFLQYAEEHPSEVLVAIEDKTDAMIRELQRRERGAVKRARKSLTRAELSAIVPF